MLSDFVFDRLRWLGFASRVVTGVHGLRAQMEEFVEPILRHRLEQEQLYGADWPDKPVRAILYAFCNLQ